MRCIIVSTLLIFSMVLPSLAKVSVNLPDQDISVLNFRGAAEFGAVKFYNVPGQPAIPVFECTVLLPPDANLKTVSFTLNGLMEKKLPGQYNVLPTEPFKNVLGAEHWPKSRSIVNGRDIGVYDQNALFPRNIVEATEIGQMNCFKIVKLKVAQFRFNPVTMELYKVNLNNFNVDYLTDSGYRANRSSTRIPYECARRLKRMVVNYDEFFSHYEADYRFVQKEVLAIIISDDDKSKLSNFDAFVEAKKQFTSYEVQVVSDDDWGGGTGETAYENIRTWLQENLQTRGLNYALLIGACNLSSSKVPMHYFADYANWGSSYPEEHDHCETDWGYCQLNGDFKDDRIPDLHVGRIPIYDNHSTVDEILQKTIDYFTAKKEDCDWRYNALLCGPGYNSGSTSWKALNPAYHEYIEPMEPTWSAFRCYANSYGQPEEADLVSSDISPTWAAGSYSIISWGAHGYSTGASSTISSTKTTSIGNEYPGFAMCGSCSNADISAPNNLSYAILKNCGMGAIGGTDYTVISGDMRWIKLFVGHLAVDSLTIGATHSVLIENCSSGWLNRAPYVLYGDPTVGVYTYVTETDVSNVSNMQPAKVKMYAQAIPGKMVQFHFRGVDRAATMLSIYSANGVLIKKVSLDPGTSSYSWKSAEVGAGLYIARLSVKRGESSTIVASIKTVVK